jgi:hypothetical protein
MTIAAAPALFGQLHDTLAMLQEQA